MEYVIDQNFLPDDENCTLSGKTLFSQLMSGRLVAIKKHETGKVRVRTYLTYLQTETWSGTEHILLTHKKSSWMKYQEEEGLREKEEPGCKEWVTHEGFLRKFWTIIIVS